MPLYWVKNQKNKVVAEISESGLSVHDQALSWQLQKLRQEKVTPFSPSDASDGRDWNLYGLLTFFEDSGYAIEAHDDA
jgi:hypothetical protein